MIVDHISNAHCYPLGERFEEAFRFLSRDDLGALPTGRYDINDDAVFALVQTYDTRPPLPRRLETHKKYVDVQFLVSGLETIGLAPLHGLTVTDRYDVVKDAAFYTADEVTEIPLRTRHFMILFPHEAHQPCLHPSLGAKPVAVKKIVVKVLCGNMCLSA